MDRGVYTGRDELAAFLKRICDRIRKTDNGYEPWRVWEMSAV